MPLPTTPIIQHRAALSLDELLSEMNTPRQEFEMPNPAEQVPIPGDRTKIDPDRAETVSAETAAAAGKQIAGLVVNASQALCGFIGSEKGEKYKVSKSQENDLAESYAKVAAYYNMSEANPVVTAIILSIVILAPGFRDAISDRRIKKIEEEQKQQAAELKRQSEEMARMRIVMEQERMKVVHNEAEKDGRS